GEGHTADIRMGSVPGRRLEGKDMTVMPRRREGGEQSRGADPGSVGGGIGEPGRDEQNLRRSALRPGAGRDRFLADNGGPRRGQVLVAFDAVELTALPDATRLGPERHAPNALRERRRATVRKRGAKLRVIGKSQLDLVAGLSM